MKKNKHWKLILSVALFVVFLFVVGGIIFSNRQTSKQEPEEVETFKGIQKAAELCTLECYYHDVAVYEKEPDKFFNMTFFNYGAKKYWMEYDGIVRIGIDVDKMKIEDPTQDGLVKVYVPRAEIISISENEDSIQPPVSEKGILTDISFKEKMEAFKDSQKSMEQIAKENTQLIEQATDIAKEVIEQFIVETGNLKGKSYQVEWLSEAPKF